MWHRCWNNLGIVHSFWCSFNLMFLKRKKKNHQLFYFWLCSLNLSLVWHHLCFPSLLISLCESIVGAGAPQSSLKVRNCWSCFYCQLIKTVLRGNLPCLQLCGPAFVSYPFAFWIFILSCFLLGHDFIAQSQLHHSAEVILELCCLLDSFNRGWKMLRFAVNCCKCGSEHLLLFL